MSQIQPPLKAEQQALFISQVAEDWLFAYTNAQNSAARETMWPHLVEAVEELISESRRLYTRQTKRE